MSSALLSYPILHLNIKIQISDSRLEASKAHLMEKTILQARKPKVLLFLKQLVKIHLPHALKITTKALTTPKLQPTATAGIVTPSYCILFLCLILFFCFIISFSILASHWPFFTSVFTDQVVQHGLITEWMKEKY